MFVIKILFIRDGKSFLPEIDAYIKYFNNINGLEAYDSSQLKGDFSLEDFDVLWEFKGIGGVKKTNKILIHEYASLSTGNFYTIKNFLKTKINPLPDLRIFLNEQVKEGFKFQDEVGYSFRDMGVDDIFLNRSKNVNKDFEFVYVGPITKEREVDRFLSKYDSKKNGRICLVGNVEDDIYNKFKGNTDIVFTGKVPHRQVPEIAERALYGLNYIPNKYPYNKQTSTKLLEYLALGLNIVTTDYEWVRLFEKENNCAFYYIESKEETFKDLSSFSFQSNFDAEDYSWENIIERANIKNKLFSIIKS